MRLPTDELLASLFMQLGLISSIGLLVPRSDESPNTKQTMVAPLQLKAMLKLVGSLVLACLDLGIRHTVRLGCSPKTSKTSKTCCNYRQVGNDLLIIVLEYQRPPNYCCLSMNILHFQKLFDNVVYARSGRSLACREIARSLSRPRDNEVSLGVRAWIGVRPTLNG